VNKLNVRQVLTHFYNRMDYAIHNRQKGEKDKYMTISAPQIRMELRKILVNEIYKNLDKWELEDGQARPLTFNTVVKSK
jgi:hypothetical protein